MRAPDQPTDLLKRLRLGDNEAFGYLYRRYYHPAAAFVKANSGSDQEARDVFQEALLALFKCVRNDDFRLTTELGAFLQAIVRKLWLYRLRTRQTHPEILLDEAVHIPESGLEDLEFLFHEKVWDEKHQAVKQLLETLKTECQKLIEYAFYHQLPPVEIARLLGYAESFVKVKKHRCMEALREKVKNHPLFNDEK